jgi:hypothetical protein
VRTLLLAQAADRGDGLLLPIAAGLALGLAVGFAYAAVRRVLGRRRRARHDRP